MFKKPTIFSDDSGSHVLGKDGSVKASFTVADHGASHEGAAISHLQQNFDNYMGEEVELDESLFHYAGTKHPDEKSAKARIKDVHIKLMKSGYRPVHGAVDHSKIRLDGHSTKYSKPGSDQEIHVSANRDRAGDQIRVYVHNHPKSVNKFTSRPSDEKSFAKSSLVKNANEEVEQVDEAQKAQTWFSSDDHDRFENMTASQKADKLAAIEKLTGHSDNYIRNHAKNAAQEFKTKYMGEEAEQIDEVGDTSRGKKVLKAYIPLAQRRANNALANAKSDNDAADKFAKRSTHTSQSQAQGFRDRAQDETQKAQKRLTGIERATKRLKKEETEQTDETVYNGHRPTGLHGSNPLPKDAMDKVKAKLDAYDKKMDDSRKKFAKEDTEQVDEIFSGISMPMLPTKKGPNPYDGAKLPKGKSLGAALKHLDDYKKANPEKFAIKEEVELDEGQKPYVSTRQGHAVVLGPNGQEVKKFTKAQHGASYMTKANAYLDQHYSNLSKQKNEEVELDEAGMPGSVIRDKEAIRNRTDADNAKQFAGKSLSDLRSMAWRHGYGKGSTKYDKFHDGVTGGSVSEGTLDKHFSGDPQAMRIAKGKTMPAFTEPKPKENKLMTGALKKLQEGRGRPPKEGSAAWKAQQAAGGQSEDTPGLEAQLLRHKDQKELGSHEIKFNDGKTHKVSPAHRDKVLNAIRSHRGAGTNPDHRDAALKHMSSSHENFMKWAHGTVKKVEPKGWELNKTPRFT